MSFLFEEISSDSALGQGTSTQAFTFYGTWDGTAAHQNGNACNPPSVKNSVDHYEAETWVTAQRRNTDQAWDAISDKVILIGHSYGGYRATVFAQQLAKNRSIRAESLITVDGISWETCNISTLLKALCDQQHHPPKLPPLTSEFRYSFYQTVGVINTPLGGLVALYGFSIPGGSSQEVTLTHTEIDDEGLQPEGPPEAGSVHGTILDLLRERVRRRAIAPRRSEIPTRDSAQIAVKVSLLATGLVQSEGVGVTGATLNGKNALNITTLANLGSSPYGSVKTITLLFPSDAVKPKGSARLRVIGQASGQTFTLDGPDVPIP